MSEIKICGSCGKDVVDHYAYCPSCGAKIQKAESAAPSDERAGIDRISQAPTAAVENAQAVGAGSEGVKGESRAADLKTSDKRAAFKASFSAIAGDKKNKKALIRDAVLTAVAFLLFVFSFLGVFSYRLSATTKATVSAADIIDIGFSSFKSLTREELKETKLDEKLKDASEALYAEGVVSAESGIRYERLVNRYLRLDLKYDMMSENADGTGLEAAYITSAFLCLAYIVFSGVLFCLSVLSLLKRLGVVGRGNMRKFDLAAFAPFGIGLLVAILVAAGVTVAGVTAKILVAGTMVASLVLLSALAALLIAERLLSFKGVKRKSYAARLVSALLIVVTMSVFTAPIVTAKVKVDSDEGARIEKTSRALSYDAIMECFDLKSDNTEAPDQIEARINSYMDSLASNSSEKIRYGLSDPTIKLIISTATHAYGQKPAAAFSVVYFFVVLIELILGCALALLLSGKKRGRGLMNFALVLAVMALIATVSFILIQNDNFDFYKLNGFELTINAGAVFACIFAIAAVVSEGVIQSKYPLKETIAAAEGASSE